MGKRGAGGGGDGARKKAKSMYVKQAKEAKLRALGHWVPPPLSSVTSGFVVSCQVHQEAKAIRDAYRVLGAVIEELYGPWDSAKAQPDEAQQQQQQAEAATGGAGGFVSLADELAEEVKQMASSNTAGEAARPWRLSSVKSKVEGLLVISCQDPAVDTHRVVQEVIRRQKEGDHQLARFIIKIRPIEAGCKPTTAAIGAAAAALVAKHFPCDGPAIESKEDRHKFGVEPTIRHNDVAKKERMAIINAIASLIPQTHHCVGLANPEKVVCVDVYGTAAFLGVCDWFRRDNSFNIAELWRQNPKSKEKESESESESGESGGDDDDSED